MTLAVWGKHRPCFTFEHFTGSQLRLVDSDSTETETGRKPAPRRGGKRRVQTEDLATFLAESGLSAEDLPQKAVEAVAALLAERVRLDSDLARARARVRALEKLAHEDAMMPVANRRAFMRELSRLLALTQRHGIQSAIIYMDLNGFKAINDRFGHNAGDAVLRRVAQILVEQVRQTDIVARLGGDEFAVLLVKTDQEAAELKCAALTAALSETILMWEGARLHISVAPGVHVLRADETAEEALEHADQAMYREKRLFKTAMTVA
jgi:diguanylate cyclase (GGDEF)-like protein